MFSSAGALRLPFGVEHPAPPTIGQPRRQRRKRASPAGTYAPALGPGRRLGSSARRRPRAAGAAPARLLLRTPRLPYGSRRRRRPPPREAPVAYLDRGVGDVRVLGQARANSCARGGQDRAEQLGRRSAAGGGRARAGRPEAASASAAWPVDRAASSAAGGARLGAAAWRAGNCASAEFSLGQQGGGGRTTRGCRRPPARDRRASSAAARPALRPVARCRPRARGGEPLARCRRESRDRAGALAPGGRARPRSWRRRSRVRRKTAERRVEDRTAGGRRRGRSRPLASGGGAAGQLPRGVDWVDVLRPQTRISF